jgi:hypothetical protein
MLCRPHNAVENDLRCRSATISARAGKHEKPHFYMRLKVEKIVAEIGGISTGTPIVPDIGSG